MTTIGEQLGLRVAAISVSATLKQPVDLPAVGSDTILGIEVEVEQHAVKERPNAVWQPKPDGSLRNNGIEYVSSPLSARLVPAALKNLLVDALDQSASFSMRTSIHVHMNVQDMTPQQLVNLIGVYCLFEPLLYRYVGRGRHKNIYCVPINETILACELNRQRLRQSWEKYTGLNYKTVTNLGTLEFRHLAGSFDVRYVVQWVQLICAMRDYVMLRTTETQLLETLVNMDDDFDLILFMQEVFRDYAPYLPLSCPDDLRGQVGKMKAIFTDSRITTRATTVLDHPQMSPLYCAATQREYTPDYK